MPSDFRSNPVHPSKAGLKETAHFRQRPHAAATMFRAIWLGCCPCAMNAALARWTDLGPLQQPQHQHPLPSLVAHGLQVSHCHPPLALCSARAYQSSQVNWMFHQAVQLWGDRAPPHSLSLRPTWPQEPAARQLQAHSGQRSAETQLVLWFGRFGRSRAPSPFGFKRSWGSNPKPPNHQSKPPIEGCLRDSFPRVRHTEPKNISTLYV